LACVALAACSSGGKSSSTTAKPGAGGGLSSLAEKAAKAVYEVRYQSSGETVVVAQDPPKYSLVQGDVAVYGSGGATYVECSGLGLAATCAELPDAGGQGKQSLAGSFGSVASTLFDALGKAGSSFGGVTMTTATIAGRSARCVSVDSKNLEAVIGDALKGTLTVCADTETGVLLKAHVDSASGTTDIVATSFGPPTAADFQPPSTPITVPP
jgi:hypothetical protein